VLPPLLKASIRERAGPEGELNRAVDPPRSVSSCVAVPHSQAHRTPTHSNERSSFELSGKRCRCSTQRALQWYLACFAQRGHKPPTLCREEIKDIKYSPTFYLFYFIIIYFISILTVIFQHCHGYHCPFCVQDEGLDILIPELLNKRQQLESKEETTRAGAADLLAAFCDATKAGLKDYTHNLIVSLV
jgi:hypothetical protein